MVLPPVNSGFAGPSRYPAQPHSPAAKATAKNSETRRMSLLGGGCLRPFLDGINALLGLFGVLRIRVLEQGFVVVSERAGPPFLLFVKAGDLETAAGLFDLQFADDLLRLREARVPRIQHHEIAERRDGLAGNALVVLGLLRLFEIGPPGLEQRFRSDCFVLAVMVGGRFVRLDRFAERIDAIEKTHLLFAG